MLQIDLRKELKSFYSPSAKAVSVVKVPAMKFLKLDGAGDPNTSPEYRDAIMALYSAAYTLKFTLKKATVLDFTLLPVEGLWWTDDMRQFSLEAKGLWKWTMMMALPTAVAAKQVKQAIETAGEKRDLPALSKLRFERFTEGLCAQILHLGPYAAEAPTIEKLHQFIKTNGYQFNGKHHEIYMSDPRRTAPEKIKTVIRQPIRREANA